MSNQEPSELDEILDNFYGSLEGTGILHDWQFEVVDETKQAIQSLIDRKVAEARIDELKNLPKIIDSSHFEESGEFDGYFVTTTKDACIECHIRARIQQLTGDDK